MQKPAVSVIIPTYNRGDTLKDAVNSILNQTFQNFEIIVVDDCSAKPAAINLAEAGITDPRVHVVRQDVNQGQAAARSRGAEEARADKLAFLDDDDTFYPDKLHRQLAFMKDGGHKASVTDYTLPGDYHLYKPRNSEQSVEWLVATGRFLALPSTLMIDKDVFQKLGGFDPDPKIRRVEDFDFTLRLHHAGHKLAVVPEFLTHYSGFHPAKPEFEIKALQAVAEKHRGLFTAGSETAAMFDAGMDWKKTTFELTGKSLGAQILDLVALAARRPDHFPGLVTSVMPVNFLHRITAPQSWPRTGIPADKNVSLPFVPL